MLVRILGKTLILPFQMRLSTARSAIAALPYVQIFPTADLARFNLRGLTPEMFCVNIADQINVRGLLSGTVENEQQILVAQWLIDEDEYRAALQVKPDHAYWVARLAQIHGYLPTLDEEFVEIEQLVDGVHGYRLTVVTADIGDKIAPYASYQFDSYQAHEWLGLVPDNQYLSELRLHLADTLQNIAQAGVKLTAVFDETDYAGVAHEQD
ncbi:hypothetical protein SFSGTM_21450 [Sulfuriferula nivalis]|uniref:Uncharacterized protein n=1 Tax=Sulfuriferula nivalis TaxID=2675298 RepID=A0A809SEH8_9PROT|nr:hypothetical protein SFSGTM_21450 [Sulfuriferula nivalis]